MKFRHQLVGSQTVILGNNGEEDVLKLRTYHLKLHEGATFLLLHNDLYPPGVQYSLVFFVSEINFLCSFHLDVLDIIYNGNMFAHVTLKGVFNVLDEIRHLPSLPHFLLCFRHIRLNHEG